MQCLPAAFQPGPGSEPQGAGSGVVLTPDGYIISNSHVVQGATKPAVSLTHGHRLDASLIGPHPPTDLALIHAHGSVLVHAEPSAGR
jgi:S1-C subfamily serine protease